MRVWSEARLENRNIVFLGAETTPLGRCAFTVLGIFVSGSAALNKADDATCNSFGLAVIRSRRLVACWLLRCPRVPSKPIASHLVGLGPRALLPDCREPSSSS